MAAFGAAGAGAALSPLLSGFGSSMLLNTLFSNQPSSQYSIPNLTAPSINNLTSSTSPSATNISSISECVSTIDQPTTTPQAILPFAAAAAEAAASFSDPRVLSQYSAALSSFPSSAATASSLFNLLSSTTHHNSMEDGSNVGNASNAMRDEITRNSISRKKSAESLINDINTKTSSIADLRMKAKKHQEALGIDERNWCLKKEVSKKSFLVTVIYLTRI